MGERFEAEDLRRRLKVAGDHRRLFGRLLGIMDEVGVVSRDPGGGWVVALGTDERPPRSSAPPDAQAESGEHGLIEHALLARCGGALADVLRGRRDPLELLFGGEPSAADLYSNAPAARALNQLAADAVAGAVSALPEGRRLRVLEVGAGTGGTTTAVLPLLPAGRTDYMYTDISPGFFAAAEQRFADAGVDIGYRALDIERDPVEQGFAAHGHDLVIAANVLHATRDLGETLAHCRRLLAPSGLLVAVEGTEPRGWLDLTFGLLPGWWRFDDAHRPDHALAPRAVWRRALAERGYGKASFVDLDGGRTVILARGPSEMEAREGLFVLAGNGDAGGALARELEGRGSSVVVGPAEGGRREWSSFFESLPGDAPLRGVVHIGGVRGDGSRLTAGELGEELEVVGGGALALVQGMADAGVVAADGVWLVTRGGQVVERETSGALSGAALWGFGSVVELEHGDLVPRLLDLDPESEISAGVLADELLFPDRETRIAWRRGKRRVPRLVRARERLALPDGGDWRLAPDPDGSLERLRVEPLARTTLQPGEIRVAVEAAGVNFLDVMLGMGLVDAVRTLGGEMCGRVVETGPEVDGPHPGARVMGFAAGAFGPEVTVRSELVVPAPPGFSPSELATVPVAFATAALAFDFAGLEPGARVLIHAGTGGVGQAAIQLARAAGYEVYATASASKREHLRSLGVSGAFDSRSPGFGAAVREATGGAGVGLVVNSLTGEGFVEASLSCVADGGCFVELGKRGIWSAEEMAAARPDVRYRILALDRLMLEEPKRLGSVLGTVAERLRAGEIEPLPLTRWPLAEAGSALDHMRVAGHVGKIVLVPSALATGRLRPDRSYLVTGGLGGIGLEVAAWLAKAGAGAIVLNGRREPDPRAEAVVTGLKQRGVEVRVEIVDVTDPDAVAGMFRRIDAGLPPLGGVFHSVGVLADAAVANLDWARFDEVLGPKALGAWRLHRATLDLDLDLFVLFSSAAGVLGNPGQANHAAANAFLDQLARHRRALGLPGQAIAWGAWSGVGEAEEQRGRIGNRLSRFGGGWMAPERGVRALAHLIRQDVGTSMAAAVDWTAIASRPPFVEELVASEDHRVAAVPADRPRQLATLPPAKRERELTRFVQAEVAAVLRLRSSPSAEVGFFDLGMDSLMAVELRNRLNRAFAGDLTVSNTAVFDHPDARRLARHLAERLGAASDDRSPVTAPPPRREEEGIAIVGMACRFPGGPDLAAFGRLLESGGDAVARGRPDGLYVDARTEADRPFGGYVEGIDRFDADFFRIAPVEAEFLDPQQRLLLETSWAAIEDAGVDPGGLHGSRTGVYGGLSSNDYQMLIEGVAADRRPGLYRATGVTASTAVGRVAFALGLMGPAITVDTACSSSLVSIHQAAMALRLGETDLALAGGVNAVLTSRTTRLFEDGGMLAPDGRCKTFDAAADGYVRGEGCGMVVLKRLSDAKAAGDRILAVLLGSAVNQDGASAGLTVPNGPAQERVIEEALARAGIEPASVDYLEAHGTGTELGDPVEVEAAAAVYGRARDPGHPLLLGSVKTNIGHLESAAGVAGLIKTVLAIRSGVIPKHLHLDRPNPRIDWKALPVRVTDQPTRWPEVERPRRAAVSSFGYSGTNAHVVVEAYSEPSEPGVPVAPSPGHPARASDGRRPPEFDERPLAERPHRLLPLSAKSDRALGDLAARYRAWLDEYTPLADMAWTASVGRSHFACRAGIVFGDLAGLRERLEGLAQGGARGPGGESATETKVAFLYTGQGSQWFGMGRELHESEPVAREVLERCEEVFREERGESLLAAMFGDADGGRGRLDRTEWTQPALYALECALTALWRSVGIRPDAVFGHSVGEIAAAQAAGVFELEDGMCFATRRGALMGALPEGGAMAAVFAPAERVAAAVRGSVSLAADNGAHQVVSGPEAAVSALIEGFGAGGVRVERLRTSHAFHSELMEPVLPELAGVPDGASAPKIPLVSNLTGRPLAGAPDGDHWQRQAREPVQFATATKTLAKLGVDVLVEIGPDAVLGPMAALAWPDAEAPQVVASGRRQGIGDFARAVASVYEAGLDLSFEGLFARERRRRISLPTYPFQRRRHWLVSERGVAAAGETLDDLLYEVTWREGPPAEAPPPGEGTMDPGLWVLAAPGDGRARAAAGELAAVLAERGQEVLVAGAGEAEGEGVARLPVDPFGRESWRAALADLDADVPLRGVVHLGGVDGHGPGANASRLREDLQASGASALALAQGVSDAGVAPSAGLWFVTRGAQVVGEGGGGVRGGGGAGADGGGARGDGTGGGRIDEGGFVERRGEPSGAALWGFARSAALELAPVRLRLLDLDPRKPVSAQALAAELLSLDGESELALREGCGGRRSWSGAPCRRIRGSAAKPGKARRIECAKTTATW